MSKYIDAEFLRKEIGRLKDEYTDIAIDSQRGWVNANSVIDDLEQLQSQIDSLQQEQPEVDLEEAAKQCNGTCVKGKGTIVKIEDGQIKIKSNEKYQQGKSVRKYPGSSVRFQTYWKYELDYEYANLKSMLGVKQEGESK